MGFLKFLFCFVFVRELDKNYWLTQPLKSIHGVPLSTKFGEPRFKTQFGLYWIIFYSFFPT